MKTQIRTHKNTIPIRKLDGRKKPFQLRVTVGGKRRTSYWETQAEAEKEWRRLAPIAGHPGSTIVPTTNKSLVSDQEAAEYIYARERLAAAGFSMEDAVQFVLRHNNVSRKPTRPP